MKPLIVLISVFIISLFVTRFNTGDYLHFVSGAIAMSAMLFFTALGHFLYTNGMAMMIPDFVPFKKGWVYFTGLVEIAAAVCLLTPAYREMTGLFLIGFFITLLPSNIYAAMQQIDYQKATTDGNGINYLWFRVPLQLFFIAWVYFFTIGI
jgi:uncharacterized membrane protein